MLHPVKRAIALSAICLCWNATAQVARAEPASIVPEQPVKAGATDFQRGMDALQGGHAKEAVDAFHASYALDSNPAALLNLGIAYTNLGNPHEAAKALSSYIEHADVVRDAQPIQSARGEIARLRAENGIVELHFMPHGARLQIDGVSIEPENDEVLVVPGQRHFNVSADGYTPFDQTLDVQPGSFRLEVVLKQVPAQTVSAPVVVTPVEPTAPAAPVTHDDAADEPEPAAASGCALSKVCVGPVLALLGPPNLVGGGVHMRFGRYLGAGVDYQVLPNINVNPITVGASLASATARVYPFGNAFFLGGGLAYQSIRAQLHDGDVTVGARTGFTAGTANIGFMGHDGFVLGADIGLLFPLGTSKVSMTDMTSKSAFSSGVTQAMIDSTKSQAQDHVQKLMNLMPVFLQVNLIRIGYLF